MKGKQLRWGFNALRCIYLFHRQWKTFWAAPYADGHSSWMNVSQQTFCFVFFSWCVSVESSRGGAPVRPQRKPRVCGPREASRKRSELLQRWSKQVSDRSGAAPGHPARGWDWKKWQGQEDCGVGKVSDSSCCRKFPVCLYFLLVKSLKC